MRFTRTYLRTLDHIDRIAVVNNCIVHGYIIPVGVSDGVLHVWMTVSIY